MANIEGIKQKILELDAGSFQNLCDTYFNTSDGKYIFVEYTTQRSSLFAKIKDDLTKCLDISKTGIYHEVIDIILKF